MSLSAADDRAIRKALANYEAAWNSHDMKALGGLFREDAEFINVVGMHWRGRADIVAAHAAFHETMFKDCLLKTDAIALRPLGVMAPSRWSLIRRMVSRHPVDRSCRTRRPNSAMCS